MRSPHALLPYPRTITDRLVHWAAAKPDAVFLAERGARADWRTIGYADTLDQVRRVAQGLIDRGCTAQRGVAILSENGIDHGVLALAAQYAGIPYVPVAPPYSLMSNDFAKLGLVLAIFAPGLIFTADESRYARALASDAMPAGVPIVTDLAALRARTPTAAVEAANTAVTADTVAKILFTSGSTGSPKGVINTQRMLCSNQQMNLQAFPFFADEMVLVDWSPWNHTAGSNQMFNMVLYNGGTLYIDEGKPVPGLFERSVRNLRDVAPTIYFNVPRGFEMLAQACDADAALRASFFRRLRMMWYAAATLSAPVFEKMRDLAIRECGEEIVMTSGLGSTETAPSALFANWHSDVSGNVGIPLPGLEMKLVPVNEKLEMRLRGPSITPGYLHRDDLTRDAFDEEGFYRMGDALLPLDPDDFSRGFLFNGRIGEDFKLATGTWVNVGPLRNALLGRLQPLVSDLVLCGHDRDFVTMLMFADPAELARFGPDAHGFIAASLAEFARENPGSSRHVVRAIFVDSPPSIDAGEITDKRSLNNGIVRERRRPLIDRLYAGGDPDVIAID